MHIRPITRMDHAPVAQFIQAHWGDLVVISRGNVHRPAELDGFIAEDGDELVGLLTYAVTGDAWEVVTIDAVRPFQGIGSGLLTAVKQAAQSAGCHRLWLITTNDNLAALRFYQRRGFDLVAVHRNALEQSRQLKPQIPLIGLDAIPLRDEIELEMLLTPPEQPGG